jgi:hypothetical protein
MGCLSAKVPARQEKAGLVTDRDLAWMAGVMSRPGMFVGGGLGLVFGGGEIAELTIVLHGPSVTMGCDRVDVACLGGRSYNGHGEPPVSANNEHAIETFQIKW